MKKSIFLLFAAFATLLVGCQREEIDGGQGQQQQQQEQQEQEQEKEQEQEQEKEQGSLKVMSEGIWYNLTPKEKQAEVTSSDGTEYSGSITLPATVTHNGKKYSVTSIGSGAFEGCSRLTAITLPEGVTSIGDHTFFRCSSLTAINIPEGVTNIGRYAFAACSSLTTITLPEGVTSIGDVAFSVCSSLTAINIPESVTSIGGLAFSDCSSLTAVHISSIEAWCKISFSNSSSNPLSCAHNLYLNGKLVTEIVIPESVTSIGWAAFYGCSSLKSVKILAVTPPGTGYDTFYGIASDATLYVPKEAVSTYRSTNPWSNFFSSINSL